MPFDKSLTLRIVSAAVLMPVVLWAIMYGGLPFYILIGVGAAISLYEWFGMTKARPLWLVGGVAYIVACFAAFVYLRLYYSPDSGVPFALVLLLCVWATDIGAYFSGKTIGGPKMAPTISPNKTWAGLIGGVVSSVAAFFLFAQIIGPFMGDAIWSTNNLPEGFTAPVIIALGVMIAVIGQIGDLAISLVKRKVGVKDTGALIPGHGGILDRIDSLLLAAPAFLACLMVLGL